MPVKEYIQKVKAIRWTGSIKLMQEIKKLYPEGVRMWIVKDKGLRIDYDKYQGADWVIVGNYLILKKDKIDFMPAENFKKTFKIVKG